MNNRYRERHFQSLADKVKKTISDALEALGADPNEQEIKCQLFARGKSRKSLQKNLVRADSNAAFATADDIEESKSIWDLAGVRILTYFPDDGPRAALKVRKLFPTLASNPVVKDGKRIYVEQCCYCL